MFEALLVHPFPFFLDYSLFAPMILRIVVGAFFFSRGWKELIDKRATPKSVKEIFVYAICFIGGLSMIAGFQIQIVSIIFALFLLYAIFAIRKGESFPHSASFYALLLAMCLSLLISGPGLFGLGLPL